MGYKRKKRKRVRWGGATRGEDFAQFGTSPQDNLHLLDQIFYLEISFQVIMKKSTYIYVFDPIHFY
jgi:hypothetical protein